MLDVTFVQCIENLVSYLRDCPKNTLDPGLLNHHLMIALLKKMPQLSATLRNRDIDVMSSDILCEMICSALELFLAENTRSVFNKAIG